MADPIPKDRYVLIVGAMKCGTSSLFSYLAEHPQICPAARKEPEFFSENQNHGIELSNYDDLWEFDASIHRYVLEASTGYTKYPAEPNVAKNIFQHGIDPKLIYVIRNPYDRISSHFNFFSFRRKTQKWQNWQHSVVSKYLIDTSNYFLQLEQYSKYFPVENMLLLDFKELVESPEKLLQKVYAFLGVSEQHFPDTYINRNPINQKTAVQRRIQVSPLAPMVSHIPKPLRTLGKRMLPQKSLDKQQLTQAQRDYIYKELETDMAKLQQFYGFNVSQWRF